MMLLRYSTIKMEYPVKCKVKDICANCQVGCVCDSCFLGLVEIEDREVVKISLVKPKPKNANTEREGVQ